MLIIGCDFHPSVNRFAALDRVSGRRWEGQLTHEGDQVRNARLNKHPASQTEVAGEFDRFFPLREKLCLHGRRR